MKNLSEHINYYIEQYQQVKTNLPGSNVAWLNIQREKALSQFAEVGFPNRKHEEWKYTNINRIAERPFNLLLKKQVETSENNLLSHSLANHVDCYRFVFIDGRFNASLSEINNLPQGVTLTHIPEALKHHVTEWHEHLDASDHHNEHAFAALNSAFMQDGYFLRVADHVKIEKPIVMLFVSATPELAQHIRNIVIAGKHSEFTVIEDFIGETQEHYLCNALTTITAADHAKLNYYKCIREGKEANHVANTHVQQQSHSEVNAYSFVFKGALVRSDTQIVLADEFAQCALNGLYMADGQQHIDHHTQVKHTSPNCLSSENYKGVLNGEARAVFNGKVIVAVGAQKTNAKQMNKNLLLSRKAEIDTKPQLEIFANDVKCTHGATVGQLDENALFYCCSRGISEKKARELLMHAFADEIINSVPNEKLREALGHYLNEVL